MSSTPKMNPWVPDNNPHQARRIGKTLEELGELAAVLARISIQGLHATDPSSGKTNYCRMVDETADVLAQLECNLRHFVGTGRAAVEERVAKKIAMMEEWEAHYAPADEVKFIGVDDTAEQFRIRDAGYRAGHEAATRDAGAQAVEYFLAQKGSA